MPDTPKIICLCGSSRFVAEMAIIMWSLERDEAVICLGLHLLPQTYPGLATDHQAEAEGVAAKMDELHRRKIDLADWVLILNVGGYIGESTRNELAYAHQQGKRIEFLEPEAAEEGRR